MSSGGNTFSASTLLVLAAIIVVPAAHADPDDCTYAEEYVLGEGWTLVCDAGWSSPRVYAVEELGYDPCVFISYVDDSTIEVTMPTVCVDETLAIRTAMKGTIFVWQ